MGWILGLGIPTSIFSLWMFMGPRVGKAMALRNKQYNLEQYPNIAYSNGTYRFKGDMKLAYVLGFIFWPPCWVFLKISKIVDPLVEDMQTPKEREAYIRKLEKELGL